MQPKIAHKPKDDKKEQRRRSIDQEKARRASFSGAEGDECLYSIVNGRCQKCNARIDVASMETYGPDKKLLQKFETLMIQKQSRIFGKIVNEIRGKVQKMVHDGEAPDSPLIASEDDDEDAPAQKEPRLTSKHSVINHADLPYSVQKQDLPVSILQNGHRTTAVTSHIIFNERTSKSVPKRRIVKQETSGSPAQQRGNRNQDYRSKSPKNVEGYSFRGASDPAKGRGNNDNRLYRNSPNRSIRESGGSSEHNKRMIDLT